MTKQRRNMSPAETSVERYVTSLSLPRHMAEHVAAQATARAMSQAAYVRLLIYRDMQGEPAASH